MHLLEADVSSHSLPWFMDPEASRNSDSDSDMIQTPSRIKSGLPSRVGDHAIRGKSFVAPTPRVYSKMGIDLNEIHHRPYSPTENPRLRSTSPKTEEEHPQDFTKNDLQRGGGRRFVSPGAEKNTNDLGDNEFSARSIRSSEMQNDVKSSTTYMKASSKGYINGYAADHNRRHHEITHNFDEVRDVLEDATLQRDSGVKEKNALNRNANNNIHVNISSTDGHLLFSHVRNSVHRKSPDFSRSSETEDGRKYSHKGKIPQSPAKNAEYYNYRTSLSDEEDGESLNGSDILKRMYASFGPKREADEEKVTIGPTKSFPTSHFRKRKHSQHETYSDCNDVIDSRNGSALQKPSPIRSTAMRSSGRNPHEEELGQKRRKTSQSMERNAEPERSQSPLRHHNGHPGHSTPIDLGRRTSNSHRRMESELRTEPNRVRAFHSFNGEIDHKVGMFKNGSPGRRSTIDSQHGPQVTSPSHSIDALLSKRGAEFETGGFHGDDRQSVRREDDERRLPSPEASSPRSRGTRAYRSPDTCAKPIIDRDREEQMVRSKYTDANKHNPEPAARRELKTSRGNEDAYNDKSREIFLREKELIENSLRQNALPFSLPTDPAAFQNPYFLDPNALAAFQSGLLASNAASMMHDQNIMLKSASMAAASPFMLGLGQYFANPYLLRGLIGNGLPGAAYTQAMTQGFLGQPQSIMPFLNAVPGAPVYPGPSSVYGPMSVQDSEPITAAIAASIRQNVAAYQTGAAPYPFLPNQVAQQIHQAQLQEVKRDSLNSLPKIPYLKGRLHSKHSQDIKKQNHDIKRSPGRLAEPDSSTDRRKNDAERSVPTSSRIHSHEEERSTMKDFPSAFSQHLHPPKDSRRITKDSGEDSHSPPAEASSLPRPNQILKRKPLPLICDRPLPKRRSYSPDDNDSKYSRQANSNISPDLLLKNLDDTAEEEEIKPDSSSVLKNHPMNGKTSRPSSYKNLTRERRLVANARERTRVHTISSAFEELRHQIPSYSCNQKLSKLAILRIACSYIQSLSVLAGRNTEDTFSDSVDQCTRVLQAESRARSRRKSNKAQIEWEVANYEKTPGFGSDEKGDNVRRSREDPSSVAHSSAQKSPIHDGYPQVYDETPLRKAAETSRAESELPRGAQGPHTPRHDSPNRYKDQVEGDVFVENQRSVVDSLDATTAHNERLHVNDTKDVKSRMNHAPKPTGDSNMVGSTWRASGSPKAAVKGAESAEKTEHDRPGEISCQTREPKRSGGPVAKEIGDDQQNEVINVED